MSPKRLCSLFVVAVVACSQSTSSDSSSDDGGDSSVLGGDVSSETPGEVGIDGARDAGGDRDTKSPPVDAYVGPTACPHGVTWTDPGPTKPWSSGQGWLSLHW